MSVLQIFRGDDFLEEVVLARAVMGLGRHPQNDIVLDDRSLSRFHARVERRGDRFVVVDCGAQNGVHVNGKRVVGESSLAPGDRITLGGYVAVFHSGNGTSNAEAELALPEDGTKSEQPPQLDDVDFAKEPALVLLFNGAEVSRHRIGAGGITVGRGKASDIVINLLGLSRQHSRIVKGKDGIFVEDLGSQNGTWVNNQRIQKTKALKHGDLLNFYDYAVLFLEDGAAEVVLPGAQTSVEDLAHPGSAAPIPGPQKAVGRPAPRASATHSGVPIADSSISRGPAAPLGSRKPSAVAASASELIDLGEGSFLGEEFADDGKEDPPSVVDDDRLDDLAPDRPDATEIVDVKARKRDKLGELDAALAEANAFDDLAGTARKAEELDGKTSAGVGEGRRWPRDEELLKALSNSPDVVIVTLEVTLAGKAYTQMPLSLNVTRVGTDARCDLSLPKSSGLMPWHLTLLHLGGAVVVYRAGRPGKITLAKAELDMAILKDGDVLDLGKVQLKVRAK